MCIDKHGRQEKVLITASVASMIGQFNMLNIQLLLEMGYEVHVACNFQEGNTCDMRHIHKLQETLQRMRVTWHQWDCPRNIFPIRKCFIAYRQMRQLLGRYRYAWLHCHSPIGGVLTRMAAHRAGIPAVYTAHGFHFYKGAPLKNWLLYFPVEKLLAYWTTVLITINKEDFRLARRKFQAGKVCYIPGIGVDLAQFSPERGPAVSSRQKFCRKYRIPEDAAILLSVGELNKGKNHKLVVSALAELSAGNVYYLICGQGYMKKELRRYADRLGIGGRVRMPGYQEHMPWIYQNADIFVLPSFREGMPAALMEAMASGLPCVVSDIRGNRELVCDLVFSLKHPKQLRCALEMLLQDEEYRRQYGKRNREKIIGYGKEAVGRRMKKIYAWMGKNHA